MQVALLFNTLVLNSIKGLHHEDFAVLGQFFAKSINLLPLDIHVYKMLL